MQARRPGHTHGCTCSAAAEHRDGHLPCALTAPTDLERSISRGELRATHRTLARYAPPAAGYCSIGMDGCLSPLASPLAYPYASTGPTKPRTRTLFPVSGALCMTLIKHERAVGRTWGSIVPACAPGLRSWMVIKSSTPPSEPSPPPSSPTIHPPIDAAKDPGLRYGIQNSNQEPNKLQSPAFWLSTLFILPARRIYSANGLVARLHRHPASIL